MTLLDVQDEPMMKSTKTGGLIPNVKQSELSQIAYCDRIPWNTHLKHKQSPSAVVTSWKQHEKIECITDNIVQEYRWKAILNGEKRVKMSSKAEHYLIKALHVDKDTVAVIDTRTTTVAVIDTVLYWWRDSGPLYCNTVSTCIWHQFPFVYSVGRCVCSHACVFDLYVKLCKILCQPSSS